MLGYWRNHSDYRDFVILKLAGNFCSFSMEHELFPIVAKLFILDLDPLRQAIAERYSHTGRPAIYQPELFRVVVMMSHLEIPTNKWIPLLKSNYIIRSACGILRSEIPSIASVYDFIYRITGREKKFIVKRTKRKPSYKLKKGEKLPPRHPGITQKLADKLVLGRRFKDPLAESINSILAVIVKQSYMAGIISPNINASGDGTCVETGASPYGKSICGCKSNRVFNCDCPRRYSDPNASWGWDSHREHPFYGYTGYFLSSHDKFHKVDLPIYLRLVDARRHDSVSALIALSEFLDRYPQIKIDTFISDSASDNQATYEFLRWRNIEAVIALGKPLKKESKYPVPIDYTDATPVCPSGNKMVYWGVCPSQSRLKWRCPRVLGKVGYGSGCGSCNKSSYGRTVYTKPEWDIRVFCNIPRGTERWNDIMKERTASERVNNRILNDYGFAIKRRRGKKRIAFFILIAAFNIHLDAQLKIQLKEHHDNLVK